MLYPLDDTIAAIASARGGAPRGIVRISGPKTAACLSRFLSNATLPDLGPAVAVAAELNIPPLSPFDADVFFWPSAKSYTGQPAAEIHTLGSPPILEHLLESLAAAGARLAEPGEFTLRAFLSGRIDLTQAEGVLGAVEAVGPRQLDAALVQLAGGLAAPLAALREMLLDLLAHLEAGFDFADEDLPFLESQQLYRQLEQARGEVQRLAERMKNRRESGSTVRVVLTGPPNAGKSSLFNALAADAGAIVSDVPGTTRDYLCADLNLDGMACRLIDTAGIEAGGGLAVGGADRAARDLARKIVEEADIVVHCREAGDDAFCEKRPSTPAGPPLIIAVRTKADLLGRYRPASEAVTTSVKTGEGIQKLESCIRQAAVEASMGDVVVGTAVRCHESLRGATASLERAAALVAAGEGEELVAAEMRAALDALGRVVGAVYTDDLLDRVFSRFCIGK